MKECSIADWNKHTESMDLNRLKVHRKLTNLVLTTLSSGSVLEIGAQTGIDAEFLASKGLEVTALDYSDAAMRLLKSRKGIILVKADALSMPFANDTFNLAYSQGLLEHYRQPELSQLIEEQKRVVRNEGYILIDVPNANSVLTVLDKQIRMACRKWIVPWETQFTPSELRKLGEKHGLQFKEEYSWGYLPYIGRRTDNLLRFVFNGAYEKFESKFGAYYQPCIGALFKNVKS
jgi:SAM-dependent methyltransferase